MFAFTLLSQSFPTIALYVSASVTTTLIGMVTFLTVMGKSTISPKGLLRSPFTFIIIVVDGRSIWIFSSSRRRHETILPAAPLSMIKGHSKNPSKKRNAYKRLVKVFYNNLKSLFIIKKTNFDNILKSHFKDVIKILLKAL